MKATLYLERTADDHMIAEVVFALTGVRIHSETRRNAAVIHMARAKARMRGKEHRKQPLRDLAREGFQNVPTNPYRGMSVAETIDAWTKANHPDVVAYEEYVNLGIGTLELDDNASRCGLTRDRATINALMLRTGMDRKLDSPFIASIPALRWQRPIQLDSPQRRASTQAAPATTA